VTWLRDLRSVTFCVLLMGFLVPAAGWAQDEPALPPGLSSPGPAPSAEPALPPGLGGGEETGEPVLPPGLGGPPAPEEPALPPGLAAEPGVSEGLEAQGHLPALAFDITGFWETRGGLRTQRDPHEKDASIAETRLQLELEKTWDQVTFKVTTDFLYDPVLGHHSLRLEDGQGWLDLREASAFVTLTDFLDLKVGRQVLTWGTGDLLFLNDLFPKDWNSFFVGRDLEYLKAPSDAVKVALFSPWANLDVVYTPRFDADRFVDGRRVSYYNTALGRLAGQDAVVKTDRPNDWFSDDEVAARLYRNIGSYEVAAYFYNGFWKSPAGMDPVAGKAVFPGLSVYGMSLRGPLGKGIGNAEVAYYDSEDGGGDDPFVRNSEARFLLGYEQEVAKDFTVGLQYYLERMLGYHDFLRALPPGVPRADEYHHVLTVRLTKLLMDQNLELSLFTFYSPSDADAYLRPRIHYKVDDHWSVEVGGNVFLEDTQHTFFGQFEKNSNIYAAVRYGF